MVLVAIVGCKPKDNSIPTMPAAVSQVLGQSFSSYFPMTPGTIWSYKIVTNTETEPLNYGEVLWPTGPEMGVLQSSRGRFIGAMNNPGGEFTFSLRVKAIAPQQGSLQYPQGVELEILEDTLGIHTDVLQMFWAATSAADYMVMEVLVYSQFGSRGTGFAMGDGQALRIIGFADLPNVGIGLGESQDTTVYLGIDTTVLGYEGQELLHYQRSVSAGPGVDGSPLDKAFTEDMWYAKNTGLVRLEQKVEGKPSMTWTLNGVTAP